MHITTRPARPLRATGLLLSLALLLSFASPAAAEGNPVLELAGHAEREVANDRMTVLLQAEARAPDAREAAERVNRRMQQALQRAGEHETVESRTVGYSTRAVHDRDDRAQVVAWQVRQNLELISGDFDSLTELVAALQQDELTVSQIRFSLAPETRRTHRAEMIDEAIEDWKQQARQMARSLGATHLRPSGLELVDDHYDRPQPMTAMRAIDEAATPPALEAGHSTLSVRVRGRAQALGAETLRVGPR